MDTKLSGRLKKAREDARLNQDEAAKRLAIAIPTLSRYEQGHRTPDADLLNAMVNLYMCDAGWLLTGEVPTNYKFNDLRPDEIDSDLMWKVIGEIHNATVEVGIDPKKLSDNQKSILQHLLYIDALQKKRLVDNLYARTLCRLTYCETCEEGEMREKILGTNSQSGNVSLLVKTAPGNMCPMEGKPREYIRDVPVEVPDTTYYIRLINDGSLILVDVKTAKDSTSQSTTVVESQITQAIGGKSNKVAGRDFIEGNERVK